MTILFTLIHVAVSIFLILVVLLQTGKGADLAGAFGGGGSQTAFGARGATSLLHKLTTASAVLFMATSFALAILSTRPSGSVVEDSAPAAATAPLDGAGRGEAPPAEGATPPLESPGPAGTTEPTDPAPGSADASGS